jgi:hypothetical protein
MLFFHGSEYMFMWPESGLLVISRFFRLSFRTFLSALKAHTPIVLLVSAQRDIRKQKQTSELALEVGVYEKKKKKKKRRFN